MRKAGWLSRTSGTGLAGAILLKTVMDTDVGGFGPPCRRPGQSHSTSGDHLRAARLAFRGERARHGLLYGTGNGLISGGVGPPPAWPGTRAAGSLPLADPPFQRPVRIGEVVA